MRPAFAGLRLAGSFNDEEDRVRQCLQPSIIRLARLVPFPDTMMTSAEHEPIGDDPQQAAWAWLRRLHSARVSADDADAFKAWLAASPAHVVAYRAARERWSTLAPMAGELLRRNPDAARTHASVMHCKGLPDVRRRALIGGLVGGAAAVGAVALHPAGQLLMSPGVWGADIRTGTGEQRRLELADRVSLTLNTQTSVRKQVDAGGELAGIDLLSGETSVEIGPGAAGFSVSAGVGRTTSNGGRFDVRYLDERACITCISGGVRVTHPMGQHALSTGQRLFYGNDNFGQAESIDIAVASAWHNGELVFHNTPLGEVIAEINRYRSGRVILRNEAARRQQVSGTFYISSLDQALSQLRHTFGLSERRLPGGLLLLG